MYYHLLQDGVDDSFHDKIRQVTSDAQSSKREAAAETVRRRRGEKSALDAIKRVRVSLLGPFMFACVSLKRD